VGQESEELRADIEQRRESMSETIDAIEDRVVPGRIIERKRQAAREWTGGLRDRVMGSAHSVGDQAGTAADRLSGGVSQAADKVSQAPEQLQRATAGSPLIAGAIAFGVGALVAALLPETESERKAVQAVQPQLEVATDALKDVGQRALDTAQSSARDAAQELKDSAADHAHEVTEQAKDAGKQLKDSAGEPSTSGGSTEAAR
jgi:hypothetical protein